VLDEADIELPDLLTDLQDRTQLTRRTIFKAIAVGDNPARFKKAKKLDDLVADS
jgi:type III restriction enzyme